MCIIHNLTLYYYSTFFFCSGLLYIFKVQSFMLIRIAVMDLSTGINHTLSSGAAADHSESNDTFLLSVRIDDTEYEAAIQSSDSRQRSSETSGVRISSITLCRDVSCRIHYAPFRACIAIYLISIECML